MCVGSSCQYTARRLQKGEGEGEGRGKRIEQLTHTDRDRHWTGKSTSSIHTYVYVYEVGDVDVDMVWCYGRSSRGFRFFSLGCMTRAQHCLHAFFLSSISLALSLCWWDAGHGMFLGCGMRDGGWGMGEDLEVAFFYFLFFSVRGAYLIGNYKVE